MSNTRQVDVFIPVFNDVKYIARAINSCLVQKGVDVRVLVSDNCSTDGTLEIVQNIARDDARVELHQNKTNIGMIPNLQRVGDLVTRPFYMFLCSDDFLLDNTAFSKAFDLFDSHSNLASVYSNIDFVDPNGKLILTNRFNRPEVFDAQQTMHQSLISTRNRFGIPLMHRTEFGLRYEYAKDLRYIADLWHSYKVGLHGKCGHINSSAIGNSYTGNNLTKDLIASAMSEFDRVAVMENIKLTKIEKLYQWFNSHKTYWSKNLFFKFVLPLKTKANENA